MTAVLFPGRWILKAGPAGPCHTSGMDLGQRLSAAMAAAQRGDAAAYRSVLRDCVPVVATMARMQGISGDAVDDVVQDVLITVHRVRQTYDPAMPFLPWLRAITRRRAIDVIRRRGRRPREVHDPFAYEAHPDLAPHADAGIEARDRRAMLAAAVATLPTGQREAVEHLGLHERTLEETAALTGRSKGALKVNLHRALKTLRAKLSSGKEHGDV